MVAVGSNLGSKHPPPLVLIEFDNRKSTIAYRLSNIDMHTVDGERLRYAADGEPEIAHTFAYVRWLGRDRILPRRTNIMGTKKKGLAQHR